MLRVVEGSIHVLLLSFFVVLEMFFHFKKNILYLKWKKNDGKERTL
jgi:hypothetical protein